MFNLKKEVKAEMSRVEILKKIRNLEQVIQTRSKRLAQLEAMDDPEALLESIKIRNELELLNNEKSRLVEQAETLKNSLQEKLPILEREYLIAVERERAELKKLYNTCKTLQNQIEQLRETANEVHIKYYIPYRNICDELGVVAKSMHLLELPFTSQIERWLGNFIQWYEKVQAK
jgi:exonuclease VII large subunit